MLIFLWKTKRVPRAELHSHNAVKCLSKGLCQSPADASSTRIYLGIYLAPVVCWKISCFVWSKVFAFFTSSILWGLFSENIWFSPWSGHPWLFCCRWQVDETAQLLSQPLCEGHILLYCGPWAQTLQMLPLLFWPHIHQMNANLQKQSISTEVPNTATAAASVMLISYEALVRTESNTVLRVTCLYPAICGFSFDVTVMGMTLSWTNIQLKRMKKWNWFYTDNPGIFCCNVIHGSQAEPLSKGDTVVFAPMIHMLCGCQ